MDSRRSDWPLIKHLSKTYSPKIGFFYQRVPFIDISGIPHEKLYSDKERKELRLNVDMFDTLLFEDFMVRATAPSTIEGRGDIFMRFSTHNAWLETAAQKPWISQAFHRDGTGFSVWVEVEFWLRPVEGYPRRPVYYMTLLKPSAATEGAIGVQIHDGKGGYIAQGSQRNSNAQHFADMAIEILTYLVACPEYLVQVTPLTPFRAKKSSPAKPWTFTGLPSYILFDPSKAPSGERSEDMGGTHASPRPHQRRGHWATLRAEKFKRNSDGSVKRIFRKPSWIGPREWIMEGNRYRVVSNADGTVNA